MVILLLISIGFNVFNVFNYFKLLESKQSCDNLNKSLTEENKNLSESKQSCDKSSTEDIKQDN
jgi:cell division protein FtsL